MVGGYIMYGEFERDLIKELREMNRKLDQMVCYSAMIMAKIDESKEHAKNEYENEDSRDKHPL